MHLLQLLILKTVLLRTAALQLPCPPRRIGPLAASPVCELHDDGPDYVTNAAATLTRAGLNTPAADALVIRGIDAEEEGETIEALEAYEGAVELDPNHPAALFRLGALNVQFGLVEDARDLFHRALDADPDHSAAAACLHLLQDVDATELDAQHAASIEAALADYDPVNYEMDLVPVEVARRSAVKRIPRFLTDA
jgi:tetratricopeptide (TPR) repeat protein